MKARYFKVQGTPKPAGSKRPVNIPGRKFTVLVSDSKNKPWIKAVQEQAKLKWGKDCPSEEDFRVKFQFLMQRPKAHYRTNGTLKHGVPTRHNKKPDATKLQRCVEDALTGIVWKDDNRVTDISSSKRYSDTGWTGVIITVEELAPCTVHNPK